MKFLLVALVALPTLSFGDATINVRTVTVCGRIQKGRITLTKNNLQKTYELMTIGESTVSALRKFNLSLVSTAKNYCVDGVVLESGLENQISFSTIQEWSGPKDYESISEKIIETSEESVFGKTDYKSELSSICGYYQDPSLDPDYRQWLISRPRPTPRPGHIQPLVRNNFYVKRVENGSVAFKRYSLNTPSRTTVEALLRASALDLMKSGETYCLIGVIEQGEGVEEFKIVGSK